MTASGNVNAFLDGRDLSRKFYDRHVCVPVCLCAPVCLWACV